MNTPTAGDRVLSVYGAGCGEELGTVIGIRPSHPEFDFGTQYDIKRDNGELASFTAYAGTVDVVDGVTVFHGATRIGTYLVTNETV